MILIGLSYIITPLVILLFSSIVPLSVFFIFHKKTAKKKLIATVLLSLVVCILLNTGLCVLISRNPVIICPERYKTYIDSSRRSAIRSDVHRLYPGAGLLIPAFIEVKRASYKTLEVHVTYLFYGTVDFSIDGNGVKNIDKPLI